MAVLLVALGLFIHLRFKSQLDSTIDDGLQTHADDVAALLAENGRALAQPEVRALDDEESFAVVMTPEGRVVAKAPRGVRAPTLSKADLLRATRQPTYVETKGVPVFEGAARLLIQPFESRAGSRLVVVGASLDDRNTALDNLRTLLLIGGPAALLLASLAGYGMAAASLRPVEAMRRRAAEIDPHAPGQRLPVAPARDELSRLAETLNRMIGRLEAAFEHERRFVDDASHELRTPLALLRTELELALRKHRSHEELAAALRSAAEETERLTRLAEDLLLIARSDSGELPIRPESLDAHALLERVADRFAARARAQGRLVVVEEEPPVVLEADAARLEQALENLVENALTHGEGAIGLFACATASDVELHVVDEGRGFPEAFSRRAFDRFSRADEARGRPGTGLGLAIVELIASGHGGSAGLANRGEGGADVWIRLPRVTARGGRPLHPVGAGTVAGT